jgi:DNA-binding transcriptional LysR family regulator
MIDQKLITFLKLCELMNYRKTAQALHLTQPAVSNQIRQLEQEYQCKGADPDR